MYIHIHIHIHTCSSPTTTQRGGYYTDPLPWRWGGSAWECGPIYIYIYIQTICIYIYTDIMMVSWFRLTSLTRDFVSKLECRQPTKRSSSSFGCRLHESWRIERCHRRGDRAGVVGFDDDDDDDDHDDDEDEDKMMMEIIYTKKQQRGTKNTRKNSVVLNKSAIFQRQKSTVRFPRKHRAPKIPGEDA